MRQLLLAISTITLLLISCEPEPKFLSQEQIEIEKQAIIKVNEDYHKASENKDFAGIVETLGDEVTFFGTDSAEVIESFSEFKESIRKQWRNYDHIKYGKMQEIHIDMDNQGTKATIFFGIPTEVTRNEITNRYFIRGARAMHKNDDKWFIVSGLMSIARTPMEEAVDYNLNKDSTKVEDTE